MQKFRVYFQGRDFFFDDPQSAQAFARSRGLKGIVVYSCSDPIKDLPD